MSRWVGVMTAMLLFSGAAQAAEDEEAGNAELLNNAERSISQAESVLSTVGPMTASQPGTPLLQVTSISAVQPGTVLQTAGHYDLPAPGYCPVIADILLDICANNPEDGSCIAP